MGTLYLVATPIGNLEDVTLRALRILREAVLIAAEDTRQTKKLLTHYDIHQKTLTSYHEHNKLTRLDYILEKLGEGDVALVSDAGTPALNDPGYELVRAVLEAGFPVCPVPGASAPIAALVASGLPTDSFLYLGYLPRKSGERKRLFETVRGYPFTLIFLETPHRLLASLADLLVVFGDRTIAVARELTKLHEEIVRSSISEALHHFEQQTPRGEFTLVVEGNREKPERWSEGYLMAVLEVIAASGEAPSQAAGRLAADSGWSRRAIYDRLVELRKRD